MDEQYPSISPESWESLCRDVPALREQMKELAHDQHQVAIRTMQVNDRTAIMATNVAELARRQEALQQQVTALTATMRQVLDALQSLGGGSLSGFGRLAHDVGGSVGMAKRLWKLLAAVAAGSMAMYAAFHLGESKAPPPAPPDRGTAQEPAPPVKGPQQ